MREIRLYGTDGGEAIDFPALIVNLLFVFAIVFSIFRKIDTLLYDLTSTYFEGNPPPAGLIIWLAHVGLTPPEQPPPKVYALGQVDL